LARRRRDLPDNAYSPVTLPFVPTSCGVTTTAMLGDLIPGQPVAVAAGGLTAYAAVGQLLGSGKSGSLANASHPTGKSVGRFRRIRQALPSISSTDQLAGLTAIGNDYGYDEVVARRIGAYGRSGNIPAAASGLSVNVIRGLARARVRGLRTVQFTGVVTVATGVEVAISDSLARVPSADVPRVQEATNHLANTLCVLVEAAQF
jgi:D-sedoheptulose 7-phosphate isomerase